MKRLMILLLPMLAGAFLVSCAHHHRHRPPPPTPPPSWTQAPKANDSVNLYRIGTAVGQGSVGVAREMAYQDALRQITQAIMIEVGGAPGRVGAQPVPLAGAEILPGCSYVVQTAYGYDAWVQVSFPLTEKRRLVESLK